MSIYTEDGGIRSESIQKWEYFYYDCLVSTKINKVCCSVVCAYHNFTSKNQFQVTFNPNMEIFEEEKDTTPSDKYVLTMENLFVRKGG